MTPLELMDDIDRITESNHLLELRIKELMRQILVITLQTEESWLNGLPSRI
jgi:hypothetical protein